LEWGHDTLVYAIPILLTLSVTSLIGLAWKKARDLGQYVQAMTGITPWPVLRRIKLKSLLQLLRTRAESLVALTSDVFMKRVRGLVQKILFEDEDYKGRVAFNLIYDLNRNRPALYEKHPELEPSPDLREIARRAEAVDTTLWFDRESDLQDVIACGQATTCLTLLEYLYEHYSDEGEDTAEESGEERRHHRPGDLIAEIEKLWARVKKDPKSLLRINENEVGPE
jgi:hypothetical protein